MLTGVSAITLATHDLARAVAFYDALGFGLEYGGPAARFTSFQVGSSYLNLMSMTDKHVWGQWGRAIFDVDDVDAYHAQAVSTGLRPEFSPRNDHGMSDISTSLIRTGTNSASHARSDTLKAPRIRFL